LKAQVPVDETDVSYDVVFVLFVLCRARLVKLRSFTLGVFC